MKRALLFFLFVVGLTPISKAGIVFEPYVGYGSGNVTQKALDDTQVNHTLTAGVGGLRLGLRSGGLWIAADGMTSFSGKSKEDSVSENYTRTAIFGVLGYDFMTRVRLYAGAGFSDTLTIKDGVSVGTDAVYSGGTPVKVGMGYWLARHVCLNIEYVTQDLKKYKQTGTAAMDQGGLDAAGVKTMKGSMVQGTLSFPVTLF